MSDIKVGRMILGSVETNCYIVYNGEKEAVVIDPAKNGLYDKLTENGFKVVGILLTHGHFDHIMGCHELMEKSKAKLYALSAEKEVCNNSNLNASEQIRRPYTVDPDVTLSDGEEIELAGIGFRTIATPGHTIGSCCYYVESEGWLFSGDTLFRGSIGRTDLPTGSGERIMESVEMLANTIPDDVKIYPGHGDHTTMGEEKAHNPFLA